MKFVVALLATSMFVLPAFADGILDIDKLSQDLTTLQKQIAELTSKPVWNKQAMNKQIDETNFVVTGKKAMTRINPENGKPEHGVQNSTGSATLIDREHGIFLSASHVGELDDLTLATLKVGGTKTEETDYEISNRFKILAPIHDLALLHTEDKLPTNITASKLACNDPERGDTVYAVGNPLGIYGTVTKGIVTTRLYNALHENVNTKVMGTDAAVEHGASGGAVYNEKGEIVGVVSAMHGSQTAGVFIPVSTIQAFLVAASRKTGLDPKNFIAQPCDNQFTQSQHMKLVDPEELPKKPEPEKKKEENK